jgi:uncharacterized protein YbjT (DUF2867 family)
MTGPVTVLVTGATGTTGSRVAAGLAAEGADVRRASRSGRDGTVVLDWADPATHEAAFAGVEALYLLAPVGVADPEPLVRPVLENALAGRLRRVVLLSSSAVGPGDPGLGALHALVAARAPEWAVLRPSWFAQNLVGDHPVAAGIRAGRVVTAAGNGRLPFVDAGDIAGVAVRALLDERSHDTDHVITGPEALSYDDVCALAAEAVGHPVVHAPTDVAGLVEQLVAHGYDRAFAAVLAQLDERVRAGDEDRVTDVVPRLLGRPARGVREVLAALSDRPAA